MTPDIQELSILHHFPRAR